MARHDLPRAQLDPAGHPPSPKGFGGQVDAVGCEPEADVSGGQRGEIKLVGLAEAFAVAGRYDVDFSDVRGQVEAK